MQALRSLIPSFYPYSKRIPQFYDTEYSVNTDHIGSEVLWPIEPEYMGGLLTRKRKSLSVHIDRSVIRGIYHIEVLRHIHGGAEDLASCKALGDHTLWNIVVSDEVVEFHQVGDALWVEYPSPIVRWYCIGVQVLIAVNENIGS